MRWSDDQLNDFYDRNDGRCHICGGKISWCNYGKPNSRGAWEVEHSVPRANGGTGHGNNLYAAHIRCNREKGTVTSRTARRWHGRTRAPLSRDARERKIAENTIVGGVLAGLAGLMLAWPQAVLGLVLFGGLIGRSIDPDS
jgi:5-methylcytosine-specific restriction endonuclease McrA